MLDDLMKFRWIENPEKLGERLFTFDGTTIFNLFRDYPYKLTPEQKEIFDEKNPYWAEFFKDRIYEKNNGGLIMGLFNNKNPNETAYVGGKSILPMLLKIQALVNSCFGDSLRRISIQIQLLL